MMDIEAFNRNWLEAWSRKSPDEVIAFYHPEIRYFDEYAPTGLHGTEALREHIVKVFASIPAWTYEPEAVWRIDQGFCGRWSLTIGEGEGEVHLRGFDLVLIEGDRIVHNEVYTHRLTA